MDYGDYLRWYRNVSNNWTIAAADGDLTLITARTNYTIYVQRIIVYITTDAAVSWSFEDDAGTPVQVANIPASPGDDTRWDFDFGPRGKPLTEAKDLELNVSATGLAGHIEIEAYMRRTAVGAYDAGAGVQ